MSAQKALETMCYTSERNWEGTIYTISDARYPEYNGKRISVVLKQGKNVIEWEGKR